MTSLLADGERARGLCYILMQLCSMLTYLWIDSVSQTPPCAVISFLELDRDQNLICENQILVVTRIVINQCHISLVFTNPGTKIKT